MRRLYFPTIAGFDCPRSTIANEVGEDSLLLEPRHRRWCTLEHAQGQRHVAHERPRCRKVRVYALGHEVSGSEIDEYNISRVIFNAARSAKNLAGIVVGGKAWGSLRKHHGGSYETARAATQEDEVLKDVNAKAYCGMQEHVLFQLHRIRPTGSTTNNCTNPHHAVPEGGQYCTSRTADFDVILYGTTAASTICHCPPAQSSIRQCTSIHILKVATLRTHSQQKPRCSSRLDVRSRCLTCIEP